MEALDDQRLRELFSESKLELADPGFDRSTMSMILTREKNRRAKRILIYFLGALVIEFFIFWMLWFNPSAVATTLNLVLLPVQGLGILEQVGEWILDNSYIVLPLLILLLVRKLIESSRNYSTY